MIETEIKRIIPSQYRTFAKLESGDPYYFNCYRGDALQYWFWNKTKTKENHKSVYFPEIRNATGGLINNGYFKRRDFTSLCPRGQSDGPCGFTVTGRIFEYLGIAEYRGRKGGFILIDLNKAQQLLGI